MNKQTFFNSIRPMFGVLSEEQVAGIETLLRAWEKYGTGDRRHLAYILAGVFHETGRMMVPIKETVSPAHKDRNPTDAVVAQRLENAWQRGQLPWVKTPYWRLGQNGFHWFGRGRIQNTHFANALKLEKRFNIPFTKDPNLFLVDETDAMVTVIGHIEGIWTGRKLSDYINDKQKNYREARRIVNALESADKVAGHARGFETALITAGYPAQATVEKEAPSPGGTDVPSLAEAVAAVHRAWTVTGPGVAVHRAAQDKLRKEWPTLARALDNLDLAKARE